MDKTILSVIKDYPSYETILKMVEEDKQNNVLNKRDDLRVLGCIEKFLKQDSLEMVRHEQLVANLVGPIADYFGFTKEEKYKLKLLARLHDIGKICVPSSILNKIEKLTQDEWNVVKQHATESYRILGAIPEFQHIAYEALCHHERYDGTGYPNNLRGEEIPLLSRIVSVLDAYEVMTTGRVYKKAITNEQALEELKRHSGTQFDPKVVNVVVQLFTNKKETETENEMQAENE